MVGTTLVQCTATDASGNGADCSFTVIVVDREEPRIECPDGIAQDNDLGVCSAKVIFAVVATDNCGMVRADCTPSSGSDFPIGVTPVNCVAIDAADNIALCRFIVTVIDKEPPALSGVPDDATVACDHIPGLPTTTARDQCDPAPSIRLAAVQTQGNWPNGPLLFILSRTWTATDASGNSRTQSQTLTVTNSCPLAHSQATGTDEDGVLSLALSGSDVDSDCVPMNLSYVVTSLPAHGALVGFPPNVTYVPASNYYGSDGFTFKINDGLCESAEATISIQVMPVNDPPVCAVAVGPLLKLALNMTDCVLLACNNEDTDVFLDASHSTDVEGDALDFLWLLDGVPFASGALATNAITVGTHTLTLVASDGTDGSTCSKIVQVVDGCEAVEDLILLVEQSPLARKQKRPLIEGLKAACHDFDREKCKDALKKLESFQSKVGQYLREQRIDAVTASQLLNAGQAIITACPDCVKKRPKRKLPTKSPAGRLTQSE
jgi:hypothetical protein